MQDWRDALAPQLCEPFRRAVLAIRTQDAEAIRELRVRSGRPLVAIAQRESGLSEEGLCDITRAIIPDRTGCSRLLQALCDHSLYAHEEEMCAGFLTLRGGFRVGLTGHAVTEGGSIRRLHHIGGFNIRIARSVRGAADRLLPFIMTNSLIHSTLILSAPGLGKTTMLRDAVRGISNAGYAVGLADERGEVAALHEGVPQLDVGARTDVLDGCPKRLALGMLLRTMSPRVVAMDELGGEAEVEAVKAAALSGVSVLATAHASSYREAADHPTLSPLLPLFPCVAVLQGKPGQIGALYRDGAKARL